MIKVPYTIPLISIFFTCVIVIIYIFYAAIMWFIIIKLSGIILAFHFHLLWALTSAFTYPYFCYQIHYSLIACLALLLFIMSFLLFFEACSDISYVHFILRSVSSWIFLFFLHIHPLFMPLSPSILIFEWPSSPAFLCWS